MMKTISVSIMQDGDTFVSHCLDYDIASQGQTIEESKQNIIEAVSLFLEVASPAEIQTRLDRRGSVEELVLDSV